MARHDPSLPASRERRPHLYLPTCVAVASAVLRARPGLWHATRWQGEGRGAARGGRGATMAPRDRPCSHATCSARTCARQPPTPHRGRPSAPRLCGGVWPALRGPAGRLALQHYDDCGGGVVVVVVMKISLHGRWRLHCHRRLQAASRAPAMPCNAAYNSSIEPGRSFGVYMCVHVRGGGERVNVAL